MAILGFELEDIARLLALVEKQGLEELRLEEEGRSLRIRGPYTASTQSDAPPIVTARAPRPTPHSRPASARAERGAHTDPSILPVDQIALTSPMVGVFYHAEKPGAPPLIKEGDRIEVGQVVGILEAMKVFSEFKSEHAGTVVSIPAKDGQLVQTGAPLIVLRKS